MGNFDWCFPFFKWKELQVILFGGKKLKTVTVCGSMKFEKEMKEIAFILETKYDMNVLQCVYNEGKLNLSKDKIIALNSAHLKK